MLSFRKFILEFRIMKGWMSPKGTPHLVKPGSEHMNDHHPDFHKVHTGPQSVEDAQKKGFVRFVHSEREDGKHEVVIHYDRMHPDAKYAAHKALDYLKPHHDSDVYVAEKPGLKNVDHAKLFKPAQARRHFNQ